MKLVAFGSGNVGATPAAMQFGCLANGAVQGISRGTATAAIVANQAFRWQAKVILLVRTAGSSGTALANGSWVGEQTANDNVPGTAADWGMACSFGASTTFTLNTTAAVTLGLEVATVSIDCLGAYLKRAA